MFAKLPNYPKIKGLLWTDDNVDSMDWVIESSVTSQASFASGIQNAAYRVNSYADLGPARSNRRARPLREYPATACLPSPKLGRTSV